MFTLLDHNGSLKAESQAIEVKQLTKAFGSVTAIDRLSFSICRGEIIGFLGPNGAGKSTTLRILSGIIPATSGYAAICGIPIAAYPYEVKRLIGYLPENNPLPKSMRVEEYLRFRARLKEIPRPKVRQRVQEVMELCDLYRTVRSSLIGVLSKGFRQRVGIADVLLAEPEVLMMDEPTVGLDPHQVIGLRDIIQNLSQGRTVIISSHILPEIEHYCDRFIIINQGHITGDGSLSSLYQQFFGCDTFLLQVSGELPILRQLLDTIDPSITLEVLNPSEGDGFMGVKLSTPANAELGEPILNTLAQAMGIRIRCFNYERPSLETLFLASTRKAWKEKQGG